MTQQKHLKQLVRARMEKTGERYATARRHVLRDARPNPNGKGTASTRAPARPRDAHLAGNVPAATALRVLLEAAGVRAPHTGQPFSEAMVYGIAGGIGIGVFSFLYEKENFASFYVAARHDWADDVRYLTHAAERFGAGVAIAESAGAKPGFAALEKALATGQPCIAWVDAAALPHRAMPQFYSGMSPHQVTVYEIDHDGGAVLIGDHSDEPIAVPLDAFAAARARGKKDRNRLLSLKPPTAVPSLDTLVRDALGACHAGLLGANAVGPSKSNFSLDALDLWATRLHGSKDKQSWEKVFTPGARLWRGLTSVHDFIEHYGTGGGLSRPLFAEFLGEAGDALGSKPMRALADRYAELGQAWSELADAALPDDVPMMREAKALLTRKAELVNSEGAAATEEVRRAWQRLDELAAAAQERFPLSDAACADLRATLQQRVRALHAHETAAHGEMGKLVKGRD